MVLYSWMAAITRPFTVPADVVTALPVAAGFALGLRATVARRALLARRALVADEASLDVPEARAGAGARRSMWPWVAALSLLGAWELAVYVAGLGHGRHAFPTLSSLYDEVTRWRAVKAALFAAWLALGWGLTRP